MYMSQDPNLSTSSDTRWEGLSTVAAGMILFSFNALIAYAVVESSDVLTNIPQGWFVLYGTLVLMTGVYVFGQGTLNAVQKFKSGK